MKASSLRTGRARVLALCLSACLPAQALAAAPAPARKSPARKTSKSKAPAAQEDFQSVFSAAVRFYESFEYERALAQLTRAKALAKGVEQEVPVALYQGVVRAELGQREESLAAFRTGLYLKPDATLPVKVSPKVERDFEEVRQAVQADLGIPATGTQATAAATSPADRPLQSPGLTTANVEPQPQTPAYVPSASTAKTSARVLPLVFLGAGAVAGGAASFFGLQSSTSVRSALNAEYYDQRVARLKSAEDQAFIANLLFGTASAAALGALATFLIPGSAGAPATVSTGGGSP
ncbi:hypothetical protein [Archangium violaceum]|uniref:hypothetical protein n=1 Tax=Archangium violaceum TaxID=83451 RepID=UPI0036DD3DFD